MRRTQIYLDESQSAELDAQAARDGRTRSDLIRTAIDAFLRSNDEAELLRRFREGVLAAAGAAPDFDEESIAAMRQADSRRMEKAARDLAG
jgi:metal-responsive CopG/Arc/MetJ family transcriptional regulator